MMRNPCKECDYYHPENNTCQSKKCGTGGDGYVTFMDRLFCKPYKADGEKAAIDAADDMVESQESEDISDIE